MGIGGADGWAQATQSATVTTTIIARVHFEIADFSIVSP